MNKRKKASKTKSEAKRKTLPAEAFLKEQCVHRVQRELETLRFQRRLLEEAAKHAGIKAEPVPASVVELLASRASRPPRATGPPPPAPSTCLFPPWPYPPIPPPDFPPFVRPWPPRAGELPQLPKLPERPPASFLVSQTEFTLQEAKFKIWHQEGLAGANEIEGKFTWGYAGTAGIGDPDEQVVLSTVTFGFESSFAVPDAGEFGETRITIDSCVNARFSYLDEAMSFDASSWGEVKADSQLSVQVGSEPYSSPEVILLYGESPRGSSEDIGIWHELAYSSSAAHALRLHIPGEKTVTVSETVTFTAKRHGNPAKCNALIQGFCTWDPVFVRMEVYQYFRSTRP